MSGAIACRVFALLICTLGGVAFGLRMTALHRSFRQMREWDDYCRRMGYLP